MNGIILVDKPAGWTSMDVCAKLRGALHERRIGHSGTLDPMATGLLTVFLGRATRAVEFAEADEKTYLAGMRLGLRTDTQDTSGNAIEQRPVLVSDGELEEAVAAFRGDIEQIPPMYSAIKVGGKKLYSIARKGGTVERRPRKVTIFELEITGRSGDEVSLRVRCSKGTYIRTLCDDIGERLGCGACMSSLRRTAAGAFSLDNAHTLDEIISVADSGGADGLILPVDSLFACFERITLGENEETRLRNGLDFPFEAPDGKYRAYSENGEFFALSEVSEGGFHAIKRFYEVKTGDNE